MTRDLTPADIAARTNRFSVRYWQKEIAAGRVPGGHAITCGKRRVFVVNESMFDDWWQSRKEAIAPWQAPLENEDASGGAASRKRAAHTNAALKQRVKQKLASALQGG